MLTIQRTDSPSHGLHSNIDKSLIDNMINNIQCIVTGEVLNQTLSMLVYTAITVKWRRKKIRVEKCII